jgi:hypothetical protein
MGNPDRRARHPGQRAFVFPADPAAAPAGATLFDMRGAAPGCHQGGSSYETVLAVFGVTADPVLEEIAGIVREADPDDVIRGRTLASGSNTTPLTITGRLFNGLYESTSARRS